MTHLLLILAGPTPWDMENRVVGNQSLPLTDAARELIVQRVKSIETHASTVFRARSNEAADDAAAIVCQTFGIRSHDAPELDEVNLGLWQGLTRSELKFRFPSTFPQWVENPLAVNPPDGESLEEATQRVRRGLRRILRRNRGVVVAMALRPMAMQITLGLLRGEDVASIASHLHNDATIETMSLDSTGIYRFLS